MKKIILNLLPDNDVKRKWVAIGITVLLAWFFTLLGIFVFRQYGLALFVLIPLFLGVSSSVLYGLKKPKIEVKSFRLGFISLGIYLLILFLFAIEGMICIVMASPIILIFTLIGSFIGDTILRKISDKALTIMFILIGMIPIMSFVEKDNQPTLTSVVTSIEINADLQTVWKNVVEFPQLDEPTEFIFKTGIAYPIDAKIEGTGVGAIRYCNFTTGSFVEPITVWDEPNLLKFDVEEQPEPMKELSFWDIDAPHLHDYFVSKQGQFKLTKLPNGNTLLEGTTWYYHNIRPEIYWNFWSENIIHKIHERVLKHIKTNSEKQL